MNKFDQQIFRWYDEIEDKSDEGLIEFLIGPPPGKPKYNETTDFSDEYQKMSFEFNPEFVAYRLRQEFTKGVRIDSKAIKQFRRGTAFSETEARAWHFHNLWTACDVFLEDHVGPVITKAAENIHHLFTGIYDESVTEAVRDSIKVAKTKNEYKGDFIPFRVLAYSDLKDPNKGRPLKSSRPKIEHIKEIVSGLVNLYKKDGDARNLTPEDLEHDDNDLLNISVDMFVESEYKPSKSTLYNRLRQHGLTFEDCLIEARNLYLPSKKQNSRPLM